MYLYGASGHAKVIIDIIKSMGESIEGLFDDNPAIESLNGLSVRHQWTDEEPIIISIGNNEIRKSIAERLSCKFGIGIHSSAIIASSVEFGEGSVVMPGAIINADARVGKHCIINTGASVDHECIIGNFTHISPHATLCGNVRVGEGTWVGAGATIVPGIRIGNWCTIGAGAVVIHDVPDGAVVAGVPARVIRVKG